MKGIYIISGKTWSCVQRPDLDLSVVIQMCLHLMKITGPRPNLLPIDANEVLLVCFSFFLISA